MKITIVGTGYVGLVTGACLANTGNRVTCFDVNESKIATLKRGNSPIHEPGLEELIRTNSAAQRLEFTTDKAAAYRDAEIVFICVGTPPQADGSADLTHVFDVAADVAESIESLGADAPPKLVVVKSTVPVGTSFRVRDVIQARTGQPFYFANNPEFLKEGDALKDFMKPDRIVCGVEDAEAERRLRFLYEPFVRQGHPVLFMDVLSSEMVKYASNAMLACKISFINEVARLCESLGADVGAVRRGMCTDSRIGDKFLYPGLGYGGSCFPKDTQAVVAMGREQGVNCEINSAVHRVNQRQRFHFWSKIADHFGGRLHGRRLAFWGVAFKPGTDDIREAPAVTLMEWALAEGAEVRAYDPVAGNNLRRHLPSVTVCDDSLQTLEDCDALIVCTEWSEFHQVDLDEIGRSLRGKVIFDGRNIYDPVRLREAGFTYHSVGRPAVTGNGAKLAVAS